MNSETLPNITTPRVVLRWISEDDIDSLYEIFSNPQVMRYWSTAPLADREAAAQLQREIADGNENNTMFKWGLALRDSDTVIGTTTLFNFNLFNVTNIRGVNNVNFSGFQNTLLRDSTNPADAGFLRSSRFGSAIQTAGGVFGTGGPRAFQFAVRVNF